MQWLWVALLVALAIQFSFIGWMAWQDRDAYKGREDALRDDPARASWISSAMQNDMQGGVEVPGARFLRDSPTSF